MAARDPPHTHTHPLQPPDPRCCTPKPQWGRGVGVSTLGRVCSALQCRAVIPCSAHLLSRYGMLRSPELRVPSGCSVLLSADGSSSRWSGGVGAGAAPAAVHSSGVR